jgi:hypothetical protein
MTWQFDIGNFAVGVGTMALAIATVFISHRNLRQLRSQKIAEFRMKWIDGFRVDLAELAKLRAKTIDLDRALKKTHETADLRSQFEAVKNEAVALRVRLLLRLKPDSDDADEKKLETPLRTAMEMTPPKADEQRREIVALSRKLLKREWERVKLEINTSNAT